MPDEPTKRGWSWPRADVLAAAAIVIAVLLGLTVRDTREAITSSAEFTWHHFLVFLLGGAILVGGISIWRTVAMQKLRKRVRVLEDECTSLSARLEGATSSLDAERRKNEEHLGRLAVSVRYEKLGRNRWDQIGRVNYGYIDYQPLLRVIGGGRAAGVGTDLLHQLIGGIVELKSWGRESGWDDFEAQLSEGKFAIVATPVIATFERARTLGFTMPLFFSNMGLFVSKTYAETFIKGRLTHDAMSIKIRDGKIRFLAITGEISQNLAQRYVSEVHWADRITATKDISLDALFEEVAQSPAEDPVAVFCESIYTHIDPRCDPLNEKVVNILEVGSILYPVCFALQKGDYQIRNLLNIRLLELNGQRGVLDELASYFADPVRNGGLAIQKKDVLNHYIDYWPHGPRIAARAKDSAHA